MTVTVVVLVATLFLMPAAGRAQPVETEQEGVTAELSANDLMQENVVIPAVFKKEN